MSMYIVNGQLSNCSDKWKNSNNLVSKQKNCISLADLACCLRED